MAKSKNEKNKVRKTKKIILGVILVTVILVVLDFTPFGGTIKYYSTWIDCRRRPVVTEGSGYFNAHAPSYRDPGNIEIYPGDQKYYCTPLEAERDGYSASRDSYEFPHMKAAGEERKIFLD